LLSFEDWKAKQFTQQLAKAKLKEADSRSKPSHVPDMMGAQSEDPKASETLMPGSSESAGYSQDKELVSPHFRVPLTDRFNYASLDCSARVHLSHRSAKSPASILSSKRDRYMLSPCVSTSKHEDKQFVVVELCADIRIDTVQLANHEFFSGVFKDFTVSVAKTYTTDAAGWTVAGTYRAKNVRAVQVGLIRNSLTLSHDSSLHWCSHSILRLPCVTFTDTSESTSTPTMATSIIVPCPYSESMASRTLKNGSGTCGKLKVERNATLRKWRRLMPPTHLQSSLWKLKRLRLSRELTMKALSLPTASKKPMSTQRRSRARRPKLTKMPRTAPPPIQTLFCSRLRPLPSQTHGILRSHVQI
jgi:hypothetical protein